MTQMLSTSPNKFNNKQEVSNKDFKAAIKCISEQLQTCEANEVIISAKKQNLCK